MDSLKAKDFENMFFETVNIIEDKKDYLNSINVFPVKDGDTGSNLLATFNLIKNLAKNKSLIDYLGDVKKLMIESARGNSGVIMSQFYKGFCDYLIQHKSVGVYEFAKGLEKGYNQALSSVRKPVYGTMLTVLKGASLGALQVLDYSDSIKDLLKNSFRFAQDYLKKGVNQLPVLKENKVVDAGGLGVVYMLGAWLRSVGIVPEYDNKLEKLKAKDSANKKCKYYCINALLKNVKKRDELLNSLDGIGCSVQVIENEDLTRIHLHCPDKDLTRMVCSAFGKVIKYETDKIRIK